MQRIKSSVITATVRRAVQLMPRLTHHSSAQLIMTGTTISSCNGSPCYRSAPGAGATHSDADGAADLRAGLGAIDLDEALRKNCDWLYPSAEAVWPRLWICPTWECWAAQPRPFRPAARQQRSQEGCFASCPFIACGLVMPPDELDPDGLATLRPHPTGFEERSRLGAYFALSEGDRPRKSSFRAACPAAQTPLYVRPPSSGSICHGPGSARRHRWPKR